MCSVLALSQSNRIASSILIIYMHYMYDSWQAPPVTPPLPEAVAGVAAKGPLHRAGCGRGGAADVGGSSVICPKSASTDPGSVGLGTHGATPDNCKWTERYGIDHRRHTRFGSFTRSDIERHLRERSRTAPAGASTIGRPLGSDDRVPGEACRPEGMDQCPPDIFESFDSSRHLAGGNKVRFRQGSVVPPKQCVSETAPLRHPVMLVAGRSSTR